MAPPAHPEPPAATPAAPLATQIDVNDLFAKLLSSGILKSQTQETEKKTSEPEPVVVPKEETLVVGIM